MTSLCPRSCFSESDPVMSPPLELIDTEGEGIYLLTGFDAPVESPGVLLRAARIFGCDWREVEHETVWMRPSDCGDEWLPANLGWRMWRLNLPRRWRPVAYAYCTPGESS